MEYSIDDLVPKTSEYICSSCGEMTEFEEGDDFSVCGNCGDQEAHWVPAVEEEEGLENLPEEPVV